MDTTGDEWLELLASLRRAPLGGGKVAWHKPLMRPVALNQIRDEQ
jgi:hypothetical protein